jgi:hypothetical protein
MLYFINPGELDMRLAKVFGANVKPGSTNPIGYFGTGLKYAIAVTLAYSGTVTIYSGLKEYKFSVQKDSIRGKEFSFVYMNEEQMPFTLELGKNWAPWMAYREFYSNMLDEKGYMATMIPHPAPNKTIVVVDCPALDLAHSKRHEFILESSPLWVFSNLEVHPYSGKALFNRGIKIGEHSKDGLFTYNITGNVPLTEDRTAASMWMEQRRICQSLSQLPDRDLTKVLISGDRYWEWDEMSPGIWTEVPENVVQVVKNVGLENRLKLSTNWIEYLSRGELPPRIDLSPVEQKQLDKARAFLVKLNHEIVDEVYPVESLGSNALGAVLHGKIIITREAFRQGTKRLAGTLLEEHIHIHKGYRDYSVEFQYYTIDLIITLGEEAQGEPI